MSQQNLAKRALLRPLSFNFSSIKRTLSTSRGRTSSDRDRINFRRSYSQDSFLMSDESYEGIYYSYFNHN